MRGWKVVLDWYRQHQTRGQIGFDPDGMCLKICRVSAGLPSLYPSAKEAQDATPDEHRVYKVRNLRRGMKLYYDDPNDSNRFGHIVTMIGRVKGADLDSLHDVLVETNSVKANEIVVVRGDYFPQHWGDPFVFGATWLNGEEIDYAGREHNPIHAPARPSKPKPKPKPKQSRGQAVDDALASLKTAQAERGSHRAQLIRMAVESLEKIPFLKQKG
jgi:hypothetical protein